ncbi:MAG: hypothetical protein FIA95_05710, partial [Gemmatimonadetes bacterium]|nr:hypothetical protein [Gemmatimonadota bacterium]
MNKALKLALQLVLTGLVMWIVLEAMGVNLSKLGQMDPGRIHPHAPLLALATAALLVGFLHSAALWGVVTRDLGGQRLPLGEAMGVFMAANLGRYLPGKVWQIAGLAILAKQRGIPAATATAAAGLGQGIARGAATLLGLGVLLTGPEAWLGWGRV